MRVSSGMTAMAALLLLFIVSAVALTVMIQGDVGNDLVKDGVLLMF